MGYIEPIYCLRLNEMMNFFMLFKSPTIEVEWDDVIEREIKECYRGKSNHAVIPINLFSFLTGLGSAQPKRTNPTLVKSIMDYGYLIPRLYDTPELKLKITETRKYLSSEMLTEVSELMGVGLSVAVVSELYDIQRSTIRKCMDTNERRPDWECFLKDNRKMVVESKGSISKRTSNQQLRTAIGQKNSGHGDFGIATAAVLNEDVSSTMQMIDPPVIEEGNNPNRRYVYRAYHYSSLFSFLGDEELSDYYEKMAKRLSGTIDRIEMVEKEKMYNELYRDSPSITIGERSYSGHLYVTEENHFWFLGVDKQLLSFDGFIHYENIDTYGTIDEYGGKFIINSDGIIIGNITDSNLLIEFEPFSISKLSHEIITLNDIDSIRDSSFKRYVKYLLDKCSERTEWLKDGSLLANIDGKNQLFYFYHSRNVKKHDPSKKIIEVLMRFKSKRNGILVTNLKIPSGLFDFSIINREDFEKITSEMADINIIKEIFTRGFNEKTY